MSAVLTPATSTGPLHQRIFWQLRHGPKRELWLAWTVLVVFYAAFFPMFFIVAQVQPPPQPTWDLATQAHWFSERRVGIPFGFGVIFAITGMTAVNNALIAYSMRRMSVSLAFGYSYLVIYSLAAVPGMLLLCIALIVGTLRPERNREVLGWLYDFAFLSFDGTMGVFLIGSLIWMVAILLDKNRVFPKWFGYLNLCNALTEVVVAPCWIFRRSVLAWDGQIAWWLDMVVFGIYQVTFIVMLFQMIRREDFGTGPLPDDPAPRERGVTS
ncbi:MFS transporter [Mycobacterium avium]|uniref:hypothetical protein n=1 Tax=Mycobacterium avium TaxID=1764 RepID=UPI0001B5A1C4|nr:hypothetical protein [Mycobacterium avium]ETB07505.1 hypothetical protein P863_16570 [Mycobacterium avium subsp. silvaticum ATCC 49884]ETB14620.1 hypothetical protein O972_17570 [Mycobacterium avium subsp. avium 10-9275]ETB19321.1 hypothetical protein O973_16730 [Mycobacterium avium subsp. avium 11-4751]ANR92252.1 hypothetical protein BBJ32_13810 [Mycobacterium avium]AYJ06254.1 hypothetical protein DBO90_16665 [Mycobacterium avium]